MIRRNHGQARNPHKEFFQRLRMRRTIPAPAAHGSADHQGKVHGIVVHPAEFGNVVDQLVRHQGDEIAKHDL